MQTNVKTKFSLAEKSKKFHFSRILDDGMKSWKYASFGGGQTLANPLFPLLFSTKKSAPEKRFWDKF